MIKYLFTLMLSFALGMYATPIMREAAIRFGITDKPDGNLKVHERPVAYLGGLAVYLSFLITLALVYDFTPQVLALLLSGTIVIILGLIDDFGFLTPGIKLFGQLIAVWVLIKGGVYIELEFLPMTFGQPIVAYILTALWLVGMSNAFNIIDVMDGLASTVGAVASLTLFGVAYMNERYAVASLAIAMAGALIGFLPYNRRPASIYLGDTGSLFVGLMLGALAMIGSYTQHNRTAMLAPVLILGVPIFDTFLVMFIRKMKGKPIMFGSPDHFALRLKKMGWQINSIVAFSGAVTLLLGLVSYFLMQVRDEKTAMAICAATAIVGIFAGIWVGMVDMTPKPEPPAGSEEK